MGRKGKDPHLRFRIAFEEVEGRELKEDKWKRLTNNVLVFTCRKYFPFHFFSFHFFSFLFFERKKKRNGLLVVTRTLSSTERQKKQAREKKKKRKETTDRVLLLADRLGNQNLNLSLTQTHACGSLVHFEALVKEVASLVLFSAKEVKAGEPFISPSIGEPIC